MAKRVKEPAPETGIVKAVDPSPSGDAPREVESPPALQSAPVGAVRGPTFGQRVRGFFRFLLRLLALMIILGIIGLGLYYALPWLYQRYVMPVEQNTAGMADLQSRQEQSEQELADLRSRLQSLETVQDQHDQSFAELHQRVDEIETEIAARTSSLATLEEVQSELQAQDEAVVAELGRQINLLKSMELLSRARLFLYQSNFGLATRDVQTARDLLETVRTDAPEPLAEELDEVLLRLDMTLANLPSFPVAASDDLDIAWQILLTGLPETPTPAATGTSPSTPAGTVIPTPHGTVESTSTP